MNRAHHPTGRNSATLRLHLLGPWRATLDGRPLPDLPTRHTQALLARLALAHPQPISRSQLQLDLWPGVNAGRAAPRLRTTLYLLRRALPGHLHADNEIAALDASLLVCHDVARFLDLLQPGATRASLQEGVALYRGQFLTDPPDGWALREAHRLHHHYVQALRRLLALAQTAGDAQGALAAARGWAREEPWEEQAHLAVVRALYELGDRAAAERHIAGARSLLQQQWEQRPGPAFNSLARAVSRLPRAQKTAGSDLQRAGFTAAPRAYRNAGMNRLALGAYAEAMGLLRQGARLAQHAGDGHEAHACQSLLGATLLACGLLAEGRLLAEACLPLARQQGPSIQLALLLLHLGRAAYYGGERRQAVQLVCESVSVAERLASPHPLAIALAFQARFALQLQQATLAQGSAARCAQLLADIPGLILNVHHVLAQVWLAAGWREEARRAAHQALAESAAHNVYSWIAPQALWEAAAVLQRLHERDAAWAAREKAYGHFLDHLAQFGDAARRHTIIGATPYNHQLAQFPSTGPRRLVYLPLRQAPTGRPLYPDELMPVICTLHSAEDRPLVTIAGRRARLQRLLAEAEDQGAEATVKAMADLLAVVPRTVMRDVAALRQNGIAVETRGSKMAQSERASSFSRK